MHKSFVEAGFTADVAEFLVIDNVEENSMDAYDGLNSMLAIARGRYVILCHQDIRLEYDQRVDLEARIAEIEQMDSDWAVLGNAGCTPWFSKRVRISDPYGENRFIGPLPALAATLDENFLVTRKSANIALSSDIGGFHLYGTDLCLQARLVSKSSYVIDFHLRHLSAGNPNQSYDLASQRFVSKYSNLWRFLVLRTTVSPMVIARWSVVRNAANSKCGSFCVRAIIRLLDISLTVSGINNRGFFQK